MVIGKYIRFDSFDSSEGRLTDLELSWVVPPFSLPAEVE